MPESVSRPPTTFIEDSKVAHEEFNTIAEGVASEQLAETMRQREEDFILTKQAERTVAAERAAERDYLTGLFNRRGFESRVAKILERDGQILFTMFDIDHFKNINDTKGHLFGDLVLQYLARTLENSVEITDIIGRLGGEEFAIAVNLDSKGKIASNQEILEIAERIRRNVVIYMNKVRYKDGSNYPVTVSAGVTISQPGESYDNCFQRADGFLYQAKNSGRDQSIGDNGKIVLTPVLPPDGPPETLAT